MCSTGSISPSGAITQQDCCILVEGYTDVISMHQSGIENVVASSGTSLTEGQIRLISRFTRNVTVIYDGDAAGIKASLRGIDMILRRRTECPGGAAARRRRPRLLCPPA